MAKKISFTFIAKDLYSRLTEKASRVTNKFKNSINKAKIAVVSFGGKLKKLGGNFNRLGQGFTKLGKRMSLFATLPILLITRSLVKAASDAEETRSKFAIVFKSIGKESENTADMLAKNYGLAGTKARELMGNTGDLLTGFGFTQKSALDLSKQVNELAVDLASFTNFSGGAEGASAALTKALLGERESVKSLGISILEEDVKRKVQILRSQGMRFATMRQAKAFATLKIAQDQSKNAIGDYNRTQDQFANKQRILAARTQDLSEKFGKILIPIMLKLTEFTIKVVEWFTKLSPSTQKLILITAGLVAVLGPLLILFGAIAAAIAVISIPIALIVLGIGVLIGALILLKNNWIPISDAIGGTIEQIGINFNLFVDNVISNVGLITSKFKEILNLPSKLANAGADLFGFGDSSVDINKKSESIITGSKSSHDVNVNLRAPQGTIENIKSRTTGKSPGLNVGVNMAIAQ